MSEPPPASGRLNALIQDVWLSLEMLNLNHSLAADTCNLVKDMKNSKTLFLISIIFLFLILGCNPRNHPIFRQLSEQQERAMRKAADEKIEKEPVFQEINKLCTKDIPIYEGFSLVTIHSSWNEKKYLSYFYFSEADWRKVRVFYTDYFTKNGWKIIQNYDTSWGSNTIEIKKENYRVVLYNNGLGEAANYGFHCEKISEDQNNNLNSK